MTSVEVTKEEASASVQRVPRDFFATGLGVLMATLGSAVGLGNIWKFPYLTGSNGGAAFLVVYLLCTLLVGLPIMAAEQMIGRKGRGDAITALKRVAPKGQAWWLIGAGGILAAFLIMAFYTEVAGWVFAYIFKSFGALLGGASFLSTNPEVTGQAFSSLVADPVQSLLWQWIVLGVTCSIILLGVSRGIEATTRRLMPVLFLLLVVVGIRSLTLPGAEKGLEFLFKPDFTKITFPVVLTAMGLAFFKLSIGMGCMITYGGYYQDDQDIPGTATRVVLADLAVSLLAGVALFPAVFAFGFKPDSGPSLLFITAPAVFASMPLGSIFMTIFFVLTAIASIGAMLSLLEVIASFLQNRVGMGRGKAVLVTALTLALIGSTAALSNNVLSGVKLFGLTFFDLYDFVSSNILLPLGGLLIAVLTGWLLGFPYIQQALSNEGKLNNGAFVRMISLTLKVVTPPLVLVILLGGLGVF